MSPAHRVSMIDRFWAKVQQTDGCWLWTGARTGAGYGALTEDFPSDRQVGAHRYAYELLVAPIPDGRELDHLCRVRHCVRPDHLEAVDHALNMRRADLATGIRSAATHCPKGHPYDEANTYHRNGRRHCRACARLRARRGASVPAGRG